MELGGGGPWGPRGVRPTCTNAAMSQLSNQDITYNPSRRSQERRFEPIRCLRVMHCVYLTLTLLPQCKQELRPLNAKRRCAVVFATRASQAILKAHRCCVATQLTRGVSSLGRGYKDLATFDVPASPGLLNRDA